MLVSRRLRIISARVCDKDVNQPCYSDTAKVFSWGWGHLRKWRPADRYTVARGFQRCTWALKWGSADLQQSWSLWRRILTDRWPQSQTAWSRGQSTHRPVAFRPNFAPSFQLKRQSFRCYATCMTAVRQARVPDIPRRTSFIRTVSTVVAFRVALKWLKSDSGASLRHTIPTMMLRTANVPGRGEQRVTSIFIAFLQSAQVICAVLLLQLITVVTDNSDLPGTIWWAVPMKKYGMRGKKEE